MLFPIRQLIEGHEKLLCVPRTASIQEALTHMIGHDYSQLPVLHSDGTLLGLVSDRAIIKSYFHTGGNVPLMQVSVDNCLENAITIAPDQDIFEALDLLKNVYAVVVTENNCPVSILTNDDMAHFFRDFSEGLILIEDIEVSLRDLVADSFPDQKELREAFQKAFGPAPEDPEHSSIALERLSFRDITLIINKSWPAFEDRLGNRIMFANTMEPVREIRNQLAHFRGRLEPVQKDALINARRWLTNRLFNRTAPPVQPIVKTRKYTGLQDWFKEQSASQDIFSLSFDALEAIMGDKLPESALVHRAWWGNDLQSHTQATPWLNAGFQVKDVDLDARTVVFRRSKNSLYQAFFLDLLKRIKSSRPGAIGVRRAPPQNWLWIGNVKPGYSYYWSFTSQRQFRVELFLEMTDKDANKLAFDKLFASKEQFEKNMGMPLEWQRLENRKGSRLCISFSAQITDSPEELEQLKQQVIATTLKFMDVCQVFIGEIV